MKSYGDIAIDGLWRSNPGFVQLLGLCPLLAVSNTVVNALGLGLATILVLTCSNLIVSAVRRFVREEIRIPVFVMVIAALVTAIELLMNAFLHQLYLVLGIFIPLITTNCIILGRAEAFAARNPVAAATFDGLMMGTGFALALVALGALRELLAQGTLLDGAELLFGPAAADWQLTVVPEYGGLLLAALPPGAFIGLGLLIAAKNAIDRRLPRPAPTPAASEAEAA